MASRRESTFIFHFLKNNASSSAGIRPQAGHSVVVKQKPHLSQCMHHKYTFLTHYPQIQSRGRKGSNRATSSCAGRNRPWGALPRQPWIVDLVVSLRSWGLSLRKIVCMGTKLEVPLPSRGPTCEQSGHITLPSRGYPALNEGKTKSGRLGGPHVGKMATYTMPSWGPQCGDKIRRGCITIAILGGHVWAKWLQNPCCLGDPPKRGRNSSGYKTGVFSVSP